MRKNENVTAISREFQDFLADMETLMKQAASLTGDELLRAREKISARMAAAKASVTQMSDDLSHEAQKVAANIDDQVHEEPWKAIGVGTAVGMLVGFLLARR